MNFPEGLTPYDRAFLLEEELIILGDVNFPYLVLSVTGDLAECLSRHHHLVADLHPVHLAERQ